MTAALIVTDASGCVCSSNETAETLFGIPRDEAVGRHITSTVDLLDLDGHPVDARELVASSAGLAWQGAHRGAAADRLEACDDLRSQNPQTP